MANVTLVGGPYAPVIAAQVQSGGAAESQVLERIAQVNRFLAEWTKGARINGMPPVAPPTPMWGTQHPGHDHSGGMMGKPRKRTVWSAWYGEQNNTHVTNIDAPSTRVGLGTEGSGPNKVADCVVRGIFIPGGKCYAKLDFELHFTVATHSVDYGVKVWGPTLGPYEATGVATAGAYTTVTITGVPFIPGAVQSFRFSLFATYNGGGATYRPYLVSAALHQTSTSV